MYWKTMVFFLSVKKEVIENIQKGKTLLLFQPQGKKYPLEPLGPSADNLEFLSMSLSTYNTNSAFCIGNSCIPSLN